MGRKVSQFCELDDDGELYCEFPNEKHDKEPDNIQAPEVSNDEIRLEQGTAPDRDIEVV